MTYNFKDDLLAYAIESGLVDTGVDAAPAGDTQLIDTLDEVIETNNDLNQSTHGLEVTGEAVVSMEASVAFLDSLIGKDQVSPTTMTLWRQGVVSSMESRDIPYALYRDIVEGGHESFEAEASEDAKEDAEKTKAGGESLIRRLLNILVNFAKRVKEFFVTLWNRIRKNGEAVKASGDAVARQAKAGGDEKPKNGNVKGKFSLIALNGTVNASGALSAVKSEYNEKIQPVLNDVRGSITVLNAAFLTASPKAESVNNALKSAASKLPSGFDLKLPGVKEAVYRPGPKEGFAKYFTGAVFKIVLDENKDYEVSTLTKGQIATLGSEISAYGQWMITAAASNSKDSAFADKVVKSAEKFASSLKKADKEAAAGVSEAIKATQSALKAIQMFSPNYMTYAAKVSSAAHNLATKSLAQYGKKEAA